MAPMAGQKFKHSDHSCAEASGPSQFDQVRPRRNDLWPAWTRVRQVSYVRLTSSCRAIGVRSARHDLATTYCTCTRSQRPPNNHDPLSQRQDDIGSVAKTAQCTSIPD